MAGWVPPLPIGFLPTDTTPFPCRVTNFGAIKTPGLRNIALTGPYMHNGGLSTLRQVVDFYVRGGDFAFTNADNFDASVVPLGTLRDAGAVPGLPTPEELRDGLVQFMMALTDSRVANEEAPFDHPEIFVPITGTAPDSPGSRDLLLADSTNFMQVPAVGGAGRGSLFLPPLQPFLALDPRSAALDPDADLDGVRDSTDNCPVIANALQEDGDSDTIGDVCDTCPLDPANDADTDGFCADVDNCPLINNPGQEDNDSDGLGDVCDDDDDDDSVLDTVDNCPLTANLDQLDTDGDGLGDVCDDDDDDDTVLDTVDNCPLTANLDQADNDADGLGDVCDDDDDDDTILDSVDNCPLTANTGQEDADGDGLGDVCDTCALDPDNDIDADGICGDVDNCSVVPNADQRDTNGDGYGNICDADLDNNDVVDLLDFSVFAGVFNQSDPDADFNGDGVVDLLDFGIFASSFNGAPGPSGFHPPAP
jgi:hypothetical protein